MDRERLAKLISLTQSSNDHEALAALRKANLMVVAHNTSWGEILKAPPARSEDPFSQATMDMLDYCEEHLASAPHRLQVTRWREAFRTEGLSFAQFFELLKFYREVKALVTKESRRA